MALLLLSGGCRQLVGFNESSKLVGVDGASGGRGSTSQDGNDAPASMSSDGASDAPVSMGSDAPPSEGLDGGGEAGGPFVSVYSPDWKFTSAECGACIDQNCELTARDCGRNHACNAYVACMAACAAGDAACAASCWSRVPSAGRSSQTWQLHHCAAAGCRNKCGFWVNNSKGQTCGSWPSQSPGCAACCCAELDTCDNDALCVAQAACAQQCQNDPACEADCAGMSSIDMNTYQIPGCEQGHCWTACLGEDWSCLGNVQVPRPQGSFSLYLQLGDYLNGTPRVGYLVKECLTSDATCTATLADGNTDANGETILPLPINQTTSYVSAYLEISPPAGENYQTHLFYLPEWQLAHGERWGSSLFSRAFVGSILPLDPTRGHLLFHAADCNPYASQRGDRGASNVQVTVSTQDMSTYTLYIQNGTISPTATATDQSGSGGVLNIPPGYATVTTRLADSGRRISSRTLLIRADTVTVATLTPTP
jgi:hypothetical protein